MQDIPPDLTPIAAAPDYFITRDGRVFSPYAHGGGRSYSLRELTIGTMPSGHKRVQLLVHGRVRHFLLHRLLMLTFGPPQPEGRPQVRHLDGDPANNDLSNLAWGTQKENMADEIRLGKTRRGTQQRNAKVTPGQVIAMRKAYAAGTEILKIAKEHKIATAHVRKIVRREKWAWLPDDLTFAG